MTRLVWFVLNDGRSVVAGCGGTTKDALTIALAGPERMLTLTSDDAVEQIPSSAIRDFVLFDAKRSIPSDASIYRLMNV